MLETINYNKVDPVTKCVQMFITVRTIESTYSVIKKLRIPRSLVWGRKSHILLYTSSQ